VRAHGFEVLFRNVRIGALEVDIIAKKDDLVIVVEVRARGEGALEKPLASISRSKKQSLLRAARGLWRTHLKKMPEVRRVRIDVIAVTKTEIEWIPSAITEQDV